MHCTSIFRFTRNEEAPTRYLLDERRGEVVGDFPAVYKRGTYRGREYVGYRKPDETSPYCGKFPMVIELAGGKIFTGLEFQESDRLKAYGNSKGNHAVLCEVSGDGRSLVLYFFRGQKRHEQELFNRWLGGDEISLVAESDVVGFKEKAPENEGSSSGAEN